MIKPKRISKNIKMPSSLSDMRLSENAPAQVFMDNEGRVVEVEPGKFIPAWVFEKFKLDHALIHPDSLRNKGSFDFAHKHKKQFSVAIIRDMNGRGDVLMASIIAKALKYKYGDDVKIWYVVQKGYERILEGVPWVDEIFTNRKDVKGADISFNVNNLEFKAELKEYDDYDRINRNRATIYLQNMDLYIENKTPMYVVKKEERAWAKEELKAKGHDLDKPIIGLELEGSNITRTYPSMREVGHLLMEKGYQVMYLDAKLDSGKFLYSVEQVGALVEQMAVVVTPNSYFYHLAGAMKKRATAVFGSCDGEVWTEDYEKVNVAEIECPMRTLRQYSKCWWELKCLPGNSLREKEMTKSPHCLTNVPVEHVIKKVEQHFNVRKILVVVLTYNLLDLTRQMIDSIRSFHDYDIFVIDNKSDDGTMEWLIEQEKKGIIKGWISERWTVPEAWNHGQQQAYKKGYDYVLLCNNDIILAPNYIDTVVEIAERRQAIAVTGKVINKSETTQSEFAHRVEPVEYPVITMVAGDYSALLLHRRCIEKIGAFRIFGKRYQADEDHLLRLRLSGHGLVKTHTSTFYHLLGAVVHTISEEKANKELDWDKGVRAFKRMWGIHPYEERKDLNSLSVVKSKNPHWKRKIQINFKGGLSG